MSHIDRYQIIRELGRGAMGVVLEARDPLIGRTVALKTIRLDTFGTSAEREWLQDRLFREARSAGALSHPGIVVIYDLGMYEDLAYIAMEYVDGQTLEQTLASSPRPDIDLALDVVRQTAAALDHANEAGVIHRDVKPANIMLQRGRTVKITDFGIAKITTTQQLTRTGMALGTPSYMSPEQMEALPLNGRSDQFSLAVVAYQMLTGVKPFEAESLPALVHQIVYEDRPSARAANQTLPQAIDGVFYRGLAKLSENRYEDCTAFADALDAAIKTVPRRFASDAIATTVLHQQENNSSLPIDWLPRPDAERSTVPATEQPARSQVPEIILVKPQTIHGMARLPNSLAKIIKKRTALLVGFLVSGGTAVLVMLGFLLLKLSVSPAPPAQAFVPQATKRSETPVAPMVRTFAATPRSIRAGEFTILQWSVEGATEVVINRGIGKVGAYGSRAVSPIARTTYVLSAKGTNGNASEEVVVDVIAQPLTSSSDSKTAESRESPSPKSTNTEAEGVLPPTKAEPPPSTPSNAPKSPATSPTGAEVKSELERIIATLKSAHGDLGIQSGLIATNGKELAALRELGERNYTEFKITKSKAPTKVGDLSVLLRSTDPKHNKYTIDVVIAEDTRVEKKDKAVNEPVQFLLSKAPQPYELVVNDVKKDLISGYVASPKVTQPPK